MKLASFIIFLAFLIIPFFYRPLLIVYTFFTKGNKGVDSFTQPTNNKNILKTRPKLFYSLIVFYWLLFVGVMLWAALELTSNFGMYGQFLVIGVIILAIVWGLLMFWGLRQGLKFREIFPPPSPEA
jgi:hypothetical protein